MKRFSESPSSIGTYTRCPKKYEFKYKHKLPDPAGPEAKFGGEFGKQVYATWQSRDPAQCPYPDMRGMLELLYSHPAVKGFPACPVVQDATMHDDDKHRTPQQRIDLRRMLLGQGKAIAEYKLEFACGTSRVFGFVDLILPNGIAMDLKTAGRKWTQEKLAEANQHGIYTLGLRRQKLCIVEKFYYPICIRPTEKRKADFQIISLEISNTYLKKVEESFDKTLARIESDLFPPQQGNHCRYCNFQRYCPAFGGSLPSPLTHGQESKDSYHPARIPLEAH